MDCGSCQARFGPRYFLTVVQLNRDGGSGIFVDLICLFPQIARHPPICVAFLAVLREEGDVLCLPATPFLYILGSISSLRVALVSCLAKPLLLICPPTFLLLPSAAFVASERTAFLWSDRRIRKQLSIVEPPPQPSDPLSHGFYRRVGRPGDRRPGPTPPPVCAPPLMTFWLVWCHPSGPRQQRGAVPPLRPLSL